MSYGDPIRTVAPATLPVTLAEFKAQTRVTTDDEDALMMSHLRAAVERVEQWTGLALITSTWTQTFSAWPTTNEPDLLLRRRPVQSAIIEFREDIGSPAGTMVELDPAGYQVIGLGQDKTSARIRLATNATWPVLYTAEEAVRVTYRVGYGEDADSVPELIRHAILMSAATFFGFREDVIMGSTASELPFASKALLRDWRQLAVA